MFFQFFIRRNPFLKLKQILTFNEARFQRGRSFRFDLTDLRLMQNAAVQVLRVRGLVILNAIAK